MRIKVSQLAEDQDFAHRLQHLLNLEAIAAIFYLGGKCAGRTLRQAMAR